MAVTIQWILSPAISKFDPVAENTNWTAHNTNNASASHHASAMLTRNSTPISACATVISSSSSCSGSNGMADTPPRLNDNTIGSIATKSVHWLMLLDTMFINAIGARVTVRAQ